MIINRTFFTKTILASIVIFSVALFFRTYRLSELASINYDESRDFIAERQIILQKKLTLIGPETTVGGKTFYFGTLHYYLMAPALLIARYNPLGPIYWTAILGVLTAVTIYFISRNLFSGLFYAVFPLAIIYNRGAWNPNTIPLFVALAILFLSRRKYILCGLFLGLAVQLHFTAGLAFLLLLPFAFINKGGLKTAIKLTFGLVLGISPLIFFDLRHNFLNFKSIFGAFQMTASSGRGLYWHYLLWSLPILSIAVSRIPKKVAIILILLSAGISLFWIVREKPITTQNPVTIEKISRIISDDQKNSNLNFNVASLVDPDARATSYRYFLGLQGVSPLGIGEYSVADHIYVVTFDDPKKVLYNKIYEVYAFAPKRVSKIWQVSGENIYRLERK